MKKEQDMTSGTIGRQILMFALPLMFGNVFQLLYNTVDSIVVGNFVGTQALAAVGSTSMITNLAIFFFNGFSTGAGVVISNAYGAEDWKRLHTAVETAVTTTFICCALFTFLGIRSVNFMLRLMDTPDDVFDQAAVYLVIYFAGVSGLLLYNMGSAILRAVGDSRRPLILLIITSIANIFLDLQFVLQFGLGIAGVAYATIIAQGISAAAVMFLLTVEKGEFRFVWKDIQINRAEFGNIMKIGLPTGIQSVITSFSNVFVQGYINYFGSTIMASWSCYNKVDSFIFLPVQSMAMAATTFVGQNNGAKKIDRVNKGTKVSVYMSLILTLATSAVIWIVAPQAIELFTDDPAVVTSGAMFVRMNCFFLLPNDVNHVLAGCLRGRGDSIGPMVIMLIGFVAVRQTYLFFITRFVMNTAQVVGFGYPVGWMATCTMEVLYFLKHWKRREAAAA